MGQKMSINLNVLWCMTHIVFLLHTFLETFPLLCHGIFVLHLPYLGIHLRIIEESLWETSLGVLNAE